MQQADNPANPYIDPFAVTETIRQGDTLLYLLNFADGAGPIDITGYQFVFTVKRQRTDPDSAALSQSFLTAIPGTQSQGGLLAFEAITTAQSSLIPPEQRYVFDLRYMTTAHQVGTLAEGELNVRQPISQNLLPPLAT